MVRALVDVSATKVPVPNNAPSTYPAAVSIARLNDKQFSGHRTRRIPHPLDNVIAAVVNDYRSARPSQRQAMLQDVTAGPAAILCGFAERLAAVAVRTHTVVPLHQALVAVGMAVEALDDYRDHLYPLVAVQHSAALLGTSYTALVGSVADELTPWALAQLRAFDARDDRDRSLQAFGLRTEGDADEFRYR